MEDCKVNCANDPECTAIEYLLGPECDNDPACEAHSSQPNTCYKSFAPCTVTSALYRFGPDTLCWTKPEAPASASVGGDPVTVWRGKEYKFYLPIGQFTTLLQTKDLIVRASAFQGESADEQWIGQVILETIGGQLVADVKIRTDIASFDNNVFAPGEFETLEVKAPWLGDQLLRFPTRTEDLLQRGQVVHFPSPMTHSKSPGVQWWPFYIDRSDSSAPVPRIEGIVVLCDSINFTIQSSSAHEYYWGDATDHQRAWKYAHLDLELIQMMGDLSAFTGLLPEVWGSAPSASTTDTCLDATTNEERLVQEFPTSVAEDQQSEGVDAEREAVTSRQLKRLILRELLNTESKMARDQQGE